MGEEVKIGKGTFSLLAENQISDCTRGPSRISYLLRFFGDVSPAVLVAGTLCQNVDRFVQVVSVDIAAPRSERAAGRAVQMLHLKVRPRPRLRTHVHHLNVADGRRRADVRGADVARDALRRRRSARNRERLNSEERGNI